MRSGEPGEPAELEGLRTDSHISLRPATLSPKAQEDLARTWFDEAPSDEVLAACDAASGGNPFLLEQLLRTLRAEDIGPRDPASVTAIEAIAPDSVTRSVRARVQSCGVDADAITAAVAVLGEDAQLRHVVALADTDEELAAQIIDRLRSAEILGSGSELTYAHPSCAALPIRRFRCRRGLRCTGTRPACSSKRQPPRRRLHRTCCSVFRTGMSGWWLNSDGQLATHLIRAHRMRLGGTWSERSMNRHGTPMSCATSSRGRCGEQARPRRSALRLLSRPKPRTSSFDSSDVDGSLGLLRLRRHGRGDQVAGSPSGPPPDDRIDEERQAEASLACISTISEGRSAARSRRIRNVFGKTTGDEPGELLVRQALAFDDFLAGEPIDHVVELAEEFSPPPWTGRGPVPAIACRVLACCGNWDSARVAAAEGWESARSSGALHVSSYRESFLAEIDRFAGRLADSEAEARTAWDIVRDFSPVSVPALLSVANLIATLIARGQLDEASGLADDWDLSAPFSLVPVSPILLETRGLLRLANGDLADGVEDLLATGEDLEALGFVNPAASGWRQEVVPALASLGRVSKAAAIATEGEARARRFGAPHVIGAMLRARATVEPKNKSLQTLTESVALLRDGGPPHELSRSLLELGAGLRRSGRRRDAREPLLDALEFAERSGAAGTAERAREELAAIGSRPRSAFRTGVEALTASELRTARLAADGLTNTEIAQRLFVTTKTVEKHLGNAYTKWKSRRGRIARGPCGIATDRMIGATGFEPATARPPADARQA